MKDPSEQPGGGEPRGVFDPPTGEDWRQRLARVVVMMRDISQETDPQLLRGRYAGHIRHLESFDRYVSLSRRGLERPWYRVTRDSEWQDPIDPWKHRDLLPLLNGGILGEIVHSNEVHVIVDKKIDPADPAVPYLGGYRTLIAVPHFDRGEALNWVLHLRRDADVHGAELPGLVWESNLFGRMTHNLVLARELAAAKGALESELDLVAQVQTSLLPAGVPRVEGLGLAAFSRTARRAGGDYYAAYPLGRGKTGLLIADASGHSAPATVLMAMLHALALKASNLEEPGAFLEELDRGLTAAAPRDAGMFITAAYAVVDTVARRVRHARAGHPPIRIRAREGAIRVLSDAGVPPLGLGMCGSSESGSAALEPGEAMVLLTDGVTDVPGPGGRYGVERLHDVLGEMLGASAEAVISGIRASLEGFAQGVPADDDCTLLVGVAE